ncbi:MAG: S8 family serine peptidase [Eubacterium sp.]|nr:S8 family serine peptidase [Eubacterium sp.]
MKRRIVGVMLATALMAQQFAGGIFYLDKRGTAVKAAETSSEWYENIDEMINSQRYVEGEVIARINKTESRFLRKSAKSSYKTKKLYELEGDSEQKLLSENGTATTEIVNISDSTKSTKELLEELAEDDSVVYAEPNYKFSAESLADASPDPRNSGSNLNTRDFRDMQWGFGGRGFHSGEDNYSMNIPNWGGESNMDNEVVVAVMDTGVDWTHSDLTDRMKTFSKEQQEKLGCAEHGYKTLATDQSVVDDPDYVHNVIGSHGTMVSSVIAGKWDEKGISGAASKAKIVGIELEITPEFSLASILDGFSFVKRANEAGIDIDIMNNSWGYECSSRAVEDAVRDLGANYGVLNVFSSGNEMMQGDGIPNVTSMFYDNPYVIRVGASDIDGKKAYFSTYGKTYADVFAPGQDILLANNNSESSYNVDLSPVEEAYYYGADDDRPVPFELSNYDGKKVKVEISDKVSAQGGKSYHIYSEEGDAEVILVSKPVNISDTIKGKLTDNKLTYCFRYNDATSRFVKCEVKDVDGNWIQVYGGDAYISDTAFVRVYNKIIDVADLENFQYRMSFKNVGGKDGGIYMDSIGIATSSSNFTFNSGTSFSSPAVAGAAAIFKSRNMSATPQELKAEIVGHTRNISDLKECCASSGIVDFAVPDEELCPCISEVEVVGDKHIIRGFNFGNEEGKVAIESSSGQKYRKIFNSIEKWSDKEIIAKTDGSPAGMLRIYVTSANDRTYVKQVYAGKSDKFFEKVLSSPVKEDGDTYFTANGQLIPMNDKIYFMQLGLEYEFSFYCGRIWEYDIKTDRWSEPIKLPEALADISAVSWQGKIVFEGRTMTKDTRGYVWDDSPEEHVYIYDPSSGGFERLDSTGLADGASVMTFDKKLYMFDGDKAIKDYGIDTGLGDTYVEIPDYAHNPKSVESDGAMYVFSSCPWYNPNLTIAKIENGKYVEMNEIGFDSDMLKHNYNQNFYDSISVCPIKGGFIYAGPGENGDYTSIWKYTAGVFEPFSKQLGDEYVYDKAVTSYKGYLYGLASDDNCQGGISFRATAVDTVQVEETSAPTATPKPVASSKPTLAPKATATPVAKVQPKTTASPKKSSTKKTTSKSTKKATKRKASKVKLLVKKKIVAMGSSYRIKLRNKYKQPIAYYYSKKYKKLGIKVKKNGRIFTSSDITPTGTYSFTVKAKKTKKYKSKKFKFRLKVIE